MHNTCEVVASSLILTSMLPHSTARENRVFSSLTKWRATCRTTYVQYRKYSSSICTYTRIYVNMYVQCNTVYTVFTIGRAHMKHSISENNAQTYVHNMEIYQTHLRTCNFTSKLICASKWRTQVYIMFFHPHHPRPHTDLWVALLLEV